MPAASGLATPGLNFIEAGMFCVQFGSFLGLTDKKMLSLCLLPPSLCTYSIIYIIEDTYVSPLTNVRNTTNVQLLSLSYTHKHTHTHKHTYLLHFSLYYILFSPEQ